MATKTTPVSYKDPYWSGLAAQTEQKLELPIGVLETVLLHGERSNADQVSEAGAKTPFQIIPQTRKAILDKYGIDAYLSPENSAEAAGLLLKESLKRNNNDIASAVAEYHGGTNRSNWGRKTKAYVQRVMSNLSAKKQQAAPTEQLTTFEQVQQDQGGQLDQVSIANIFDAYQSGAMTKEEAADFESDVKAGNIMLPPGATLSGEANNAPVSVPVLPVEVMTAYSDGTMMPDERVQLEQDIAQGLVKAPDGFSIGKTEAPGLIDRIAEAFTGSARETEQTRTLPDWTEMPELSDITSLAGLKTGAGTLLSSPEETAQIIKANYPDAEISQDVKGNYILRSQLDGKLYAIKPGFRASDIPRAIGGVLAFTPAGAARTIAGAGAASAATQSAIELAQAGAGGEFNASDVALSGVTGAALPAAIKGVSAIRRAITGTPTEAVIQNADNVAQAVAQPAATTAAPIEQTMEQVALSAKKAAEGGFGSKAATVELAQAAAPDEKVIEAANRLGITEYLQPDHLTTSQAYRELAQAVKSIPGSQARASEIQGLNAVGQKAQKLIDDIGGTTDLSQVNVAVRERISNTVSELSDKANAAYEDLRKALPRQTQVETKNILSFINQRADELGGKQNLSPLEKMALAKLAPKNAKSGQTVLPTYALVDDVRKEIGAAARQQGAFADADTGLAKQLYSRIDDDQFAIAEAAGLGDKYKAAKSLVRVRKGLEDDMVSLFGKQLDQSLVGKLQGATAALSKGDAEKIAKIMNAIPSDMRQSVAASALSTAFGKATQNGALNFNTFAKWFDGLRANKQAYAAIMSNLPPESRRQVLDLYRVANNISKATRERITTGRIQAVQQEIQGVDTVMGNIFQVAKRASIGVPIEAVTTSVGLPGAGLASGITSALTKGKPSVLKAADELIVSPEFQTMAINMAKNGGTPNSPAVKSFALSKPFRKFAEAAKLPRDLTTREKIINSLILSGSNLKSEGE